MLKHILDEIDVEVKNTQLIPFLTMDGDNPAYNYLPQEVIQEIEHLELGSELSFALIKNPSLELVGYITLIEDNINNRTKGVRIYSIGFVNEEIFNYIIRLTKDNLALKFKENGENRFDYIWGYVYEDYTLIGNNFMVDYANNIFISDLLKINPNSTIE